MSDVKAIFGKIASLKPFPRALNALMQMMQDPDVDMDQLANAIACDASLTANLLKGANSAYYGRPGKFETINQAVVFLGTAEVFNLVMTVGCREAMIGRQEGYDLEDGDLFAYSFNSALLAKAVAAKIALPDSQLVFTVGILKDIGKMVISQYVAEAYGQIRAMVEGGSSFREAEKAVLGIDHAELGTMVATVWQFSEKMVEYDSVSPHPPRMRIGSRRNGGGLSGRRVVHDAGNRRWRRRIGLPVRPSGDRSAWTLRCRHSDATGRFSGTNGPD